VASGGDPLMPQPEGHAARFITLMVTPEEEAEITRAATMHFGTDGDLCPLTVDQYLLGLHRAAVEKGK
jgi:hypothetical protein